MTATQQIRFVQSGMTISCSKLEVESQDMVQEQKEFLDS